MFDDFIDQLAQTNPPGYLFNQYALNRSANGIRRCNLRTYLEQMHQIKPRILLVGEAPGYRGCRLTGVPFTSQSILQQEEGLFGAAKGYRLADEWPAIQKEATATIVWQTLAPIPALPLLWNALPFHPFQPGKPQSNRTPKMGEFVWGRPFLHQLLHLFPIQTIVAAGSKAAAALNKWGLACTRIRHPSHGGKTDFRLSIINLIRLPTN